MAIPQRTKDALDRYATNHIDTGGFLRAVLTNDLFSAINRADRENLAALVEICEYIYNELPGECWGNEAKVWAWMQDAFYARVAENG